MIKKKYLILWTMLVCVVLVSCTPKMDVPAVTPALTNIPDNQISEDSPAEPEDQEPQESGMEEVELESGPFGGVLYSVTSFYDTDAGKTRYRFYVIGSDGTIIAGRSMDRQPVIDVNNDDLYYDSFMQISVDGETPQTFFYNWQHGFSRIYPRALLVQDNVIVYLGDYHYGEGSVSSLALEICDIFDPTLYYERFSLDFAPGATPQNAVSNISLAGERLSVTYAGKDHPLTKTELTLGKNLPEWQRAYYRWYADGANKKVTSGNFFTMDLDFDGIPEICEYVNSSGGGFTNGVVSYQNGKVVPFDMEYVARFYLLKSKATGKRIWLARTDVNSGWAWHLDAWTLYDFADITRPVKNELLSLEYQISLDDQISLTAKPGKGKATRKSMEAGDSEESIRAYAKQLTDEVWAEVKREYEVSEAYGSGPTQWIDYVYDDHPIPDFTKFIAFLNK